MLGFRKLFRIQLKGIFSLLVLLVLSQGMILAEGPSSPANLRIRTAGNQPPLALADSYNSRAGTLLEVPTPGVLANDSDPDGDLLTVQLVSGPSHGTLVLNADGSFNYTPAAGFTGSDSFSYRAFDGELYSNVVHVAIIVELHGTVWFTDLFEGAPPNGWGNLWSATGGNHYTTDSGGVPAGGGSYTYCQDFSGVPGSSGNLRMHFSQLENMPNLLGVGDSFHISYWFKLDKEWDFDNPYGGNKQFIMQSNYRTDDRMYIYHATPGSGQPYVYIHFQTSGGILHANVNGGGYQIPRGEWIRFDWYIEISPVSDKIGVLKGWVNGVQRWDYANIATIENGAYTHFWLATVSVKYGGENQRRWWDRFSIGPGMPSVGR